MRAASCCCSVRRLSLSLSLSVGNTGVPFVVAPNLGNTHTQGNTQYGLSPLISTLNEGSGEPKKSMEPPRNGREFQ